MGGHRVVKVRGHRVVKVGGHRVVKVRGHRVVKVRGHKVVKVRGHKVVKVRGHRVGCERCRVPRHRNCATGAATEIARLATRQPTSDAEHFEGCD